MRFRQINIHCVAHLPESKQEYPISEMDENRDTKAVQCRII